MRILQIAHDHSLTGAGIAAGRLQHGLVKIGLDNKMLVYKKAMDDPCQALPARKFLNRNIDLLTRAIDTRLDTQGLTNFSSMFWSFADRDVLNFHSISMSWFNLNKLKMLAAQYPLVLTMHDMSYGTAVCHYTAYYGNCTADSYERVLSSTAPGRSRETWEARTDEAAFTRACCPKVQPRTASNQALALYKQLLANGKRPSDIRVE